MRYEDLSDFTRGYVDAMFFTQSGDADDGGTLGDAGFYDLSPAALKAIIEDCTGFELMHTTLLNKAYELESVDYSPEHAGHDYWLTRNGHGAGFWDRGLGAIGEALSAACRHKTVDAYLGDDGKIYFL